MYYKITIILQVNKSLKPGLISLLKANICTPKTRNFIVKFIVFAINYSKNLNFRD